MSDSTSPASMSGPHGDRTGFEPRHPNAVPARCDGCPSPARWTYKGSRYCDEHAGFAPAPPRTDRAAAVAPLSDEELTLYGDLIDTVPGPGPALSWTAEARLLAEAQRARARVGVLEGQLATAREIHREGARGHDGTWCSVCPELWPCPTAKALGLDGGGSDAE